MPILTNKPMENKLNERWDKIAKQSVWENQETNHPVFPTETIISKETLKQKHEQSTLHFTAAPENTQMMSPLIESVSQKSMFLAVRDTERTLDNGAIETLEFRHILSNVAKYVLPERGITSRDPREARRVTLFLVAKNLQIQGTRRAHSFWRCCQMTRCSDQ